MGTGMDWRDRVRQRMEELNIKTCNDLCFKSGISAGSLNMALRGSHDLKYTTMNKLAEALETNSRWLFYGDELIESVTVPLVQVNQLSRYLAGDSTTGADIQVGFGVKVTDTTFAFLHYQHDMKPVFNPGDVLIIQPVEYLSSLIAEESIIDPIYVLASMPVSDNNPRFFVREYQQLAIGPALCSTKHYYSPVELINTSAVELMPSLVGVVLQSIKLFNNPFK